MLRNWILMFMLFKANCLRKDTFELKSDSPLSHTHCLMCFPNQSFNSHREGGSASNCQRGNFCYFWGEFCRAWKWKTLVHKYWIGIFLGNYGKQNIFTALPDPGWCVCVFCPKKEQEGKQDGARTFLTHCRRGTGILDPIANMFCLF